MLDEKNQPDAFALCWLPPASQKASQAGLGIFSWFSLAICWWLKIVPLPCHRHPSSSTTPRPPGERGFHGDLERRRLVCVFHSPSEGVPKGNVCVFVGGGGRWAAAQGTGGKWAVGDTPRRERTLDPALVGAGRRDGERLEIVESDGI